MYSSITEKVRKDVSESMMFAIDVVLCGGNEVDMTEPWTQAMEQRGMRVSRPTTQWMECRSRKAEKASLLGAICQGDCGRI